MSDRFTQTQARARERQRLAQQRGDAAFWRAERIADRLEELHRSPRVNRLDEADAFELVAQHRLRAARSLAAAAAEAYGEARCHSGAYRLTPFAADEPKRC
jgi:hypothetical protein